MTTNSPAKTIPLIARNSLPKWEIRGSDFWVFIALLFSSMGFCSFLGAKIATWLIPVEPNAEPPLLVALSANIGMQLGMLIAYLVFKRFTLEQDLTPPADTRPSAPQAALIGLKWLAIAYPVMFGVNAFSRILLDSLGFEQVIQDPIKMVLEGGTALELAIMYSVIVIVAPVCEEVAFRGGIFRFLHQRMPLVASIGLSAFFFALLHANLYSFAPLMTIGVMLAFAYRESGSLISNIVFHSAFNAINLGLILLFPEIT
ncbi:CPBP family intramembrane glutamic endopeptidase [Pelagicoccus sp. SDUM812005]|uniref:CPBP family intramembrane glutamic endopeptidase n=1 Tax=Pelagicoccus sp. SDUM812005 TaxID=3041257 RepID=UPI0028103E6C|nr:CPBP family intramembrane glutamic endopeptidase [Pelagicoccus sp. SDUM812005]MDQ8179801.1 CPBP family intramembrane metalloprotease [Pelagicoccus sp. SDUM812005]